MKRILLFAPLMMVMGCATMKLDTKILEKTATFSPKVEGKNVQVVGKFKRSGRMGRLLFTIIPVFQPNLDGMLGEELQQAQADAIVNLEIETKYRFLDLLVNYLAGGIFNMRSAVVRGDLVVFVEPGQVITRPPFLGEGEVGPSRKGFLVVFSSGLSDLDYSGKGITYQWERALDSNKLLSLTVNPGFMSYEDELRIFPVRVGLKVNGAQLKAIEDKIQGFNPFVESGMGYYPWNQGDWGGDWEFGDFGYFLGGGVEYTIKPNINAVFRAQRNVVKSDMTTYNYDPATGFYQEGSIDLKDWQFGVGISWRR